MRTLIVEDDLTNRLLLQTVLSEYGECHVAVNGAEAVEAFRMAADSGHRYDLVCMDILMPEMDGVAAVRHMRALEEARGIPSHTGVRIIMTTALSEVKDVMRSFRELCDYYLVKPIEPAQLLEHLESLRLIPVGRKRKTG